VNSSSVRLDEMAHDREPESEAAGLSFATRIGAPKSFEEIRMKISGDSLAGVAYGYFDVRVRELQTYRHLPTVRGELHRVRQQVPDDLLKTLGVSGDRRRLGVEHRVNANRLGISRWLYDLYP